MSKLRVKPEYVKKVELALQENGFVSKTIFADRLNISRATITKFFNSEGVGSKNFQKICRALCLDWQEISENENGVFRQYGVKCSSHYILSPSD
jgi:orotate phosphoribosyltransferase-like protein